jgi:hypothetical protein
MAFRRIKRAWCILTHARYYSWKFYNTVRVCTCDKCGYRYFITPEDYAR